jgi:hypothetical protein
MRSAWPVGFGQQERRAGSGRGRLGQRSARERLRVAAPPGLGERDDVVEERGVPDDEQRGERRGPVRPAHDEPPSSERYQRLALERLELIERVRVLDVEQARGLGVREPEPEEREELGSRTRDGHRPPWCQPSPAPGVGSPP